jgi:hypothetical protein
MATANYTFTQARFDLVSNQANPSPSSWPDRSDAYGRALSALGLAHDRADQPARRKRAQEAAAAVIQER